MPAHPAALTKQAQPPLNKRDEAGLVCMKDGCMHAKGRALMRRPCVWLDCAYTCDTRPSGTHGMHCHAPRPTLLVKHIHTNEKGLGISRGAARCRLNTQVSSAVMCKARLSAHPQHIIIERNTPREGSFCNANPHTACHAEQSALGLKCVYAPCHRTHMCTYVQQQASAVNVS